MAWNGPYGRGASRERREQRRSEGISRNLAAPEERRRWHRDLEEMDSEERAAIREAPGSKHEVGRQFGRSPAAVAMIRAGADEGEAA